MKKIVLYTMNKCPHCETAKQYLDSQKLKYRLVNVKTPSGQKELMRLGFKGVPVLKIGDQIFNGFSIKQVNKALKG